MISANIVSNWIMLECLLVFIIILIDLKEDKWWFITQCPRLSSFSGPCLIHVLTNGRPLQVDGVNIQGYTNQQAVEVLRHTGQTVNLKLIRRGFRPDEIPPAVTPSVTILPPCTTIPTTVTVMRELELERKTAEEAAQGRRDEVREI